MKFFLISKSKLPVTQLEAIASCLIASYLGEETNISLTTNSIQIVVESNKVSPQLSLFQTEQPQFPQPLLIRLVLQTPHQPHCPTLDTLQVYLARCAHMINHIQPSVSTPKSSAPGLWEHSSEADWLPVTAGLKTTTSYFPGPSALPHWCGLPPQLGTTDVAVAFYS